MSSLSQSLVYGRFSSRSSLHVRSGTSFQSVNVEVVSRTVSCKIVYFQRTQFFFFLASQNISSIHLEYIKYCMYIPLSDTVEDKVWKDGVHCNPKITEDK